MPPRLRVGIIGIGRRWPRWRAALHALRGRVEVRAVCDQRPARAGRAARELGCAAAAGPTDLLDRDDVEAVLLLGAQWFGLWPVEQAARLGKPVLCGVPLASDDAHADGVMRRVQESGLQVMSALGPSLSPAVAQLRDLLAARLGAPRLVRCDWCGREADAPGIRVLPALLHACTDLIGAGPVEVAASAVPTAHFLSVLVKFPSGQAAALNLWAGEGVRPACRLHVVTDAGEATAALPRTVRRRDGEGSHTARAPRHPLARVLLERFLDALAAGTAPEPSLGEAYRALRWARAVRRSLAEGRPVALETGPGSE